MKVHFMVSCSVDVDPEDWRDYETYDQFISDLEEALLDNMDGSAPAVCVDAGDAAGLWAITRPEFSSVPEGPLATCVVCQQPVDLEQAHIHAQGVAHSHCIADGHIDSKTRKYTSVDEAPKCLHCAAPIFPDSPRTHYDDGEVHLGCDTAYIKANPLPLA